jgi:fructan beta-fructosidase
MVFSGSAVIDWNNTSGFRSGDEEVMVACFTQTDTPNIVDQRQCIAYSNDRGRTWTKYSGNPVVSNHGLRDYRDPKVFWHAATGRWIMLVSADDHIELNASPDLKNWHHASNFGSGHRSREDPAWECPDLFELPVDGDPEYRQWVLLLSVQRQGPQGGSGMRYFLGRFDGTVFHADNPPGTTLWLDHGRDDYAGVTWSDHPDNDRQRLFIGWMSNLDYAQIIPAKTFRGVMTLPRILSLRSFSEGIRLVSAPLPAVVALRKAPPLLRLARERIEENRGLVAGTCLEIVAEFRVDEHTAAEFGFAVRKKKAAEIRVGYNAVRQEMFVDRSRSGGFAFNNDTGPHPAPLCSENGSVRLHLFLDRTSIEVFGNRGRRVITDLVFPAADGVDTELYVSNGKIELESLVIYELNSIYDQPLGDPK